MIVKKLTIISVLIIITMSMTSCASYLYSLYVPFMAYNITQGFTGNTGSRYADTEIAKINKEMEKDGDAVTLAKTYQAAYGRAFKALPPDGNTDQTFNNMRTATRYFRNILRAEGVANADHYVLTRLEHHTRQGFALIAAVYRPHHLIKVNDPGNPDIPKVLTPKSPDYYRPYRTDSAGNPLDKVVDWSAVPLECFKTQGQQAILLTAAANNVVEKKAPNNFWQAMQQWNAGNIEAVVVAQDYLACQSLGTGRG